MSMSEHINGYTHAVIAYPDTPSGLTVNTSTVSMYEPVPVMPVSALEELKKKVEERSFDHYFELGEYIGEDTIKWRITKTDAVKEIIDEYIEKYTMLSKKGMRDE